MLLSPTAKRGETSGMTFDDFLAILCAGVVGINGEAAITLFFEGELLLGFVIIMAAFLAVFVTIITMLVERRRRGDKTIFPTA
jgi:hypothetical protein